LTSGLVRGKWSAPCFCRFYPRGNRALFPFDRRLGGPKGRFGRCGEEEKLLQGIESWPSSL
jgi:hypothetical protein